MSAIRETVEEFARVRSVMGQVKAWCAAAAAITAGAVLWIGPGDIPAEVPSHRAWGVVSGVLGVVFFIALSTKETSAVGYRARALLLGAIAALVALGIGYVLREPLRDAWQLSQDGTPIEGRVTRASLGFVRGQATTTHHVAYPGGSTTLRLGAAHPEGTVVPLLQSASRPDIVGPGDADDSLISLVHRRLGWWGFVGPAIAAFCALATLIKGWDFVVGRRATRD